MAVLLAALGVILLQPGSALAEREYDFAKALWKRGYLDLAVQQYLKVLGQEGVSAEEMARAHLDLASIYQEQSQQAKEAAERQTLLEQARDELAKALKAAGQDVVLLFTARQQRALLLQNNGRYLAGLMGRPDFTGDRAAAKAEAVKAFDDSVSAFLTLATDAKALVTKVEKEAKIGYRKVAIGLQNTRVNAGLRAHWSEYYAALLFDEKDAERKRRLEKARDGFAAYGKEWDGYLISLFGHLGEGACWQRLGDHQKAQAKFTLVISARVPRSARDVQIQARIYRAASFNALDQSTRASEDLDAALRSIPRPERVEIGRQALVEKAKALERLAEQMRADQPNSPEWRGLLRQALQSARSVANRPGPHSTEAIDSITRLLTSLGVTEAAATAAEALAVAQLAVQQKQYADAVDGYRQAVTLTRRRETAAAARAWFGMGRCYYHLKQYREAAIVFDHVGREFSKTGEGPRAAYLAVQCWMLAHGESRHQAEQRASLRSLAGALSRYKDDPRISELRVVHGQLLVREGQYEEALRTFQAVPEQASGYARAQFEAGMCAYEWFLNLWRRGVLGEGKGKAQFGAAAAHLKAYIDLVGKPGDPEEQRRLGNARLILATIYSDLMSDPKAALAILETDVPEDLKAKVLPLRLKALIQTQRAEEALALLKQARASAKADPKRLENVLQMLAQALDEQAEALRETGDPEAYRAAATRTADFLLGIIRENPDQEVAMYQFVASRLIRIERYRDAGGVLRESIQRFGGDSKNQSVVLSARLSLVECSMGTREWDQAIEQLKALQEKYPASARLRSLLATCHVENGHYDDGIAILQDLFRNTYREGTRPWYEVGLWLAGAYEKSGRNDLALGVTSHVKLLHAPFWSGRDTKNLDLVERYKELHKRCGGQS